MTERKKDEAWANCCEDWGGYMNAKKAKLEEQFQEAAKNECSNPSTLFNGIAIFVNGYTNPNAEELRRIMISHGGTYHHYLRSKITTHMIASNLPYSKIIAYRKSTNPLPLCKPEWITDSIKAGKVLDFRKYLLYSRINNQPSMFEKILKQTKSDNAAPSTSTSASTSIYNSKQSPESEISHAEKISQIQLQPTSNTEISSTISNCTKNPQFLTEFYNNSRLHHIATMGAMFKDYINDLRDKSDGNFKGLKALKKYSHMKCPKTSGSNIIDASDSDDDLFNSNEESSNINPKMLSSTEKSRIIMHIDMDCFFVSVGLRDHPELKGFPIAVAHAKGNKQNISNDSDEYGSMSEVASCSYEARKAGVKNGMLLGQALKLCPTLKTIRYNFDGYKEVSFTLYDTIASYTLDIEAVSCDEMYVDCTKILQATGLNPLDFATIIRNEIKEKTSCPVSTGFGANKLQARLATKKAKPDGQFYLNGDSIKSFIRTLNVRDLPGVGYSTNQKLHQMNIQTCADLETVSLYELQKQFGKKNGQQLYEMCRGIDHNKLNLEHIRKSISAEVNYGIRFENSEAAQEFLKKLSEEISDRLKKVNLKGRTITLKIMIRAKEAPNEPKKFMGHGECEVVNKSKNLIAATDDPVIITREVLHLWNQLNSNPEDARGIGIQITKLESKSKSSGSTLLKFIARKKIEEKVDNQIDSYRNTNINNEKTKLESNLNNLQNLNEFENKINLTNKNYNSSNVNKIDQSSKNQIFETEQSNSTTFNTFQSKLEINNELKDQSVKEQNLKTSNQLKQTKQSEYFKQTKPFNKTGKVKLPEIHELDMKVLIELPEDIRNEVLNEYKESNNISEENSTHKTNEKHINNENKQNINVRSHTDISFSQIDPEFIAALPNEIKNEVKLYYDEQKRKKNVKLEEKRINVSRKGWNMFQNDKKSVNQNVKRKSKKLKIYKIVKKKDKNGDASSKTKSNEIVSNELITRIPENISQSRVCKDISIVNKSFYFDPSNGNEEHSEILTNMVKCLLDLPLSQIKLQIKEWIVNNSEVNDVDFLTLTTYLGTLPKKRRLKDLHILLKCLNRIITDSRSCIWHETYKKMLKHIQSRMRASYGYNIMIPEEIVCDKCMKCN